MTLAAAELSNFLIQRVSLLTLFPGRISYSPAGSVFWPTTKLKGISALASTVTDCARPGQATTRANTTNVTIILDVELFIMTSFLCSVLKAQKERKRCNPPRFSSGCYSRSQIGAILGSGRQ